MSTKYVHNAPLYPGEPLVAPSLNCEHWAGCTCNGKETTGTPTENRNEPLVAPRMDFGKKE